MKSRQLLGQAVAGQARGGGCTWVALPPAFVRELFPTYTHHPPSSFCFVNDVIFHARDWLAILVTIYSHSRAYLFDYLSFPHAASHLYSRVFFRLAVRMDK